MNRLQTIASFIAPHKKIADVGCDHGYLIDYAFNMYDDIKCIAIDNKIGPLNSCINNLSTKKYANNIRFSLSSGIKDIDDDTEVVILSGMGGMLICDILNDDLKNVKKIITCANKDNKEVRKKIISLNFKITNEKIVFDKNKYYQIIVFEKSNEQNILSDIEYIYGPILLKNKDQIFIDYLNSELSKYQNINSDKVSDKIMMIRGILNDC